MPKILSIFFQFFFFFLAIFLYRNVIIYINAEKSFSILDYVARLQILDVITPPTFEDNLCMLYGEAMDSAYNYHVRKCIYMY